MNDDVEATVFVAWDETGLHAAHVDAVEAAEELARNSEGHFRRVAELRLKLPPARPITIELSVPETSDVSPREVYRG
jgi:hypothetical protein